MKQYPYPLESIPPDELNNQDREKMQRVHTLIRRREYYEARYILQSIDHPGARMSVYNIDSILGERGLDQVKRKKATDAQKALMILGVFFGCIAILFIGTALGIVPTKEESQATETAQAALFTETPIPPPSATASPEDTIRAIIDDEISGNREILSMEIHPSVPSIVARWKMVDSWGDLVWYTDHEMLDIACRLRDAGFQDYRYLFTAEVTLIDNVGNTRPGDGVVARIHPEIMQQVNCENRDLLDLINIADYYEVHPALED